ncbi:MAG: acetyl-CoA carboxylase biotin carboxylase subunit [Pseudomonadota bacterium]|nr:acetyl-CoA carboxylase biotin carboxylase subunit [Pseudomonadota bacterium]MEC7615010.1 acetyl-CoA carboxylase biotin carboxylase subunit [Pseudomonadota bacterium]MEC7958036.1 acetyl-CoA carboxylase biotin carboxylase subunit [Pseudomonadota bacterium]MEC8497735.1 acetyl-CoA carboxylase biotin carboxylase subunit [Pseudomonadota bacterium]MEC8797285.1 acetyl-CoA carboxylase biotin carboxylase subunit [Pseudomonadota bacterium]
MFEKILIANRGEIAVRILRACKDLGIQTVSVYSTADKDAMHVKMADESVCIGPPQSKESYLNIPSIIAACEVSGAEAVHPGYGFLSENASFVEKLNAHNIDFIGPKSDHIKTMGDKILAKKTAEKYGLPVIPGSNGEVKDFKDARSIAKDIGYPIIIKASAGGGGRGMVVVRNEKELEESIKKAKSEADKSFDNDTVYIEKYLQNPKHIEVQIIGDNYGNMIHLGERDCSMQRRNQKLLEETPSKIINDKTRDYIGNLTVDALKKIKYSGAGTVEYLFENNEFYFMEMNTRLQVEHPVTEEITNFDLVKEQIRIASNSKLSKNQNDINFYGHSIECRVNAEDPESFMPSPGKVINFHAPGGPGVRVDSGCYSGITIPPYYDSMIAKLIVYGENRESCIARLERALEEFVVEGIKTTIPFYQKILKEESFLDGNYDIHWVENYMENI